MFRLEMSGEDARMLAETIESQLSDLSYEIANTDSLDYRETLKRRQAALRRVLAGLSPARERV